MTQFEFVATLLSPITGDDERPVTFITDDARSSDGRSVVVMGGRAYNSDDFAPGVAFRIDADAPPGVIERLRRDGYVIVGGGDA